MQTRIKNFLIEKKKIIGFFFIALSIRFFIIFINIIYWVPGYLSGTIWGQIIMNTLEPYSDYHYYYLTFADQFLHHGWIPYISLIPIGFIGIPFLYPPFFLYALIIPAMISVNLIFIPLLLADILLPIIVYKILKNFKGQAIAEWGFYATVFCPLTIFYQGGLFLNTSLVTLFFIFSLYFLTRNRYILANIFLGCAFLFKQTILFFILPINLYIILKEIETTNSRLNSFKIIVKNFGVLFLTLFIGSLPWVLIAPIEYLDALLLGQTPTLSPQFILPHISWPLHWYDFLIELGAPYWSIYIFGFLNFTLIGIFLLEIFVLLLLYYWYRKESLDRVKLIDLIVYIAILSHLFFPRGVYKYYFTFHVPLIILWICFHFSEDYKKNHQKRIKILYIFIIISLAILLIHRFLYLLVIWVIFFLMVKKNISLGDFRSEN